MNSFYDAVSGIRTGKTVTFRNDRGEDVELAVHEVVEPLQLVDSPAAREAAFLVEATGGYPFKVTFPAPSIFLHPFTTIDGAYESVEEFADAAVQIERQLVVEAIAAGGTQIQFDFPLYPYLVDPTWVASFEARGRPVADLVDAAIAADTAVLEGIPDEVTMALHICRGTSVLRGCARARSNPSPSACSASSRTTRSWSSGTTSDETVGSSRCASSEGVRRWSWGSLSTKTPVLEAEDDLLRKMDVAAGFVDGGLDRLAISPQCGFASVMVGNEIDEGAQWRKLELVCRVADRIWGRSAM